MNSKRKNRSNSMRSPRAGRGTEHNVSAEGVYNNAHFMHSVTSQVGTTVQIQTTNGSIYEGVFRTFSSQFEVVLDLVHKVNVDKKDVIDVNTLVEKMIFRPQDIVLMEAHDVDLEYATKGNFQTDTAISKFNGQVGEKELEPWDGPGCNGEDFDLNTETANGWGANDMFRKNEQIFGVQSSFDHSLAGYTLPLAKSDSKEYKEAEAKAAKIASEIENNPSYVARLELENGDEEDLFAAVVRTDDEGQRTAVDISVNSEGKYVPPAKRKGNSGQGKLVRATPPNNSNKSYISFPASPFPPHIMPHGQIITAHTIVTPPPPPAPLPIMATHQSVIATPSPHPHMHPPPPPPHPGLVNQASPQPPPPNAAMAQPPIHVQPTIISPNQNQNMIHSINQPLREHNLTPSHVQSHLPPHGVPHIHQQGPQSYSQTAKINGMEPKPQRPNSIRPQRAFQANDPRYALVDARTAPVTSHLPPAPFPHPQQHDMKTLAEQQQPQVAPPPTTVPHPQPQAQSQQPPQPQPPQTTRKPSRNRDDQIADLKKFGNDFKLSERETEGGEELKNKSPPVDPWGKGKSPPSDQASSGQIDKVTSAFKKSTLNPNAKEFVYNPNAKPFTPRSPSTPTPSRPHTPQTPGPGGYPGGPTGPLQTVMMPAAYVMSQPTAFPPQTQTQRFPRKTAVQMTHRPDIASQMQVAAATGQPLLAPAPIHQFTVPYNPPHPQPYQQMVRMVAGQTGQMMFHHEGTPHVQYMSPQGPGQHPAATGQYAPPPQQGAPPPPQPPHFPAAMVCPVIPPQTHMMQQTVQYIHQHPQGSGDH
ncbi:hypothetical protein RUM44_013284 [Polyplax serrata]|uniref:LsmAD domain-containing protein n=1 Tax=Polyplax serrata TaxID=468196 RepID=A0ABR1BFN0_POLSC